jgi:hypothetical protein
VYLAVRPRPTATPQARKRATDREGRWLVLWLVVNLPRTAGTGTSTSSCSLVRFCPIQRVQPVLSQLSADLVRCHRCAAES